MEGVKHFFQKLIMTGFLTIAVILVLLPTFSGFLGRNVDAHNVTSLNPNGQNFINENSVKYFCKHQYEIVFANFFAFKCKYIRDAKNETDLELSGTKYTLRYRNLPQFYVDEFELQPDFSWWDKYGKLIVALVIWVGLYFYLDF